MVLLGNKGLLVVLSGPSGVGKGTVCSFLKSANPDINLSISATTRKARAQEQDGVNYYFLSKEEFKEKINRGEFLEWAEVYGNFYGTPKAAVEEQLDQGKDVLLEIDIQGACKVKETYPEGIFIFLLPPSKEELTKRILGRAADSADTIKKRLSCLDEELAAIDNYQYIVVNDQVEKAADKVTAIIKAEKCRISRNKDLLTNRRRSMID
ncbi:MAG: guanylate kinase [Bacillota bacterium]